MVNERRQKSILFLAMTLGVLFAFAGCSNDSPVAPPVDNGEYSISEYWWDGAVADLTYTTISGGSQFQHELTFDRRGDSVVVLDLVDDPNNGPFTTMMSYTVNGSQITLRELFEQSLLALPTEFRMSGTVTTAPVAVTCSRALFDGSAIAGTDNAGVFRYDQLNNEWNSIGLVGIGPIRFVASENVPINPGLFAATNSDVYYSSNGGTDWAKLPGSYSPVNGLSTFKDQYVFIAHGNRIDILTPPYTTQETPIDFGTEFGGITAMNTVEAYVDFSYSGYLYVGTSAGALYVLPLGTLYESMGSLFPAATYGLGGIAKIETYNNKPIQAMAISEESFLFIQEYIGSWGLLPPLVPHDIHCFTSDGTLLPVLIGTDNGVYEIDITSPATSVKLRGFGGVRIDELLMLRNLTVLAITENGPEVSYDRGTVWIPADQGLVSADTVYNGLKFIDGSRRPGDSWAAGTVDIMNGGTVLASRELTARVIGHLDELYTEDRLQTYKDVIAIRYAVESASGDPDLQYAYKVVYLEKGTGIVMIEKYANGGVRSRTHLTR